MAPSSLSVPIAKEPALLLAGHAGLVPHGQCTNGELPSVEYQQGAKELCGRRCRCCGAGGETGESGQGGALLSVCAHRGGPFSLVCCVIGGSPVCWPVHQWRETGGVSAGGEGVLPIAKEPALLCAVSSTVGQSCNGEFPSVEYQKKKSEEKKSKEKKSK